MEFRKKDYFLRSRDENTHFNHLTLEEVQTIMTFIAPAELDHFQIRASTENNWTFLSQFPGLKAQFSPRKDLKIPPPPPTPKAEEAQKELQKMEPQAEPTATTNSTNLNSSLDSAQKQELSKSSAQKISFDDIEETSETILLDFEWADDASVETPETLEKFDLDTDGHIEPLEAFPHITINEKTSLRIHQNGQVFTFKITKIKFPLIELKTRIQSDEETEYQVELDYQAQKIEITCSLEYNTENYVDPKNTPGIVKTNKLRIKNFKIK